jgi:UDP-glucose 4-epimerase
MSKRKSILVTGGAGYIGSVTSKLLLEANHDIIIIDNLSSGSIRAIPKGAEFIKGDVANSSLLEKVFKKYKFDCVIHFAALIRIEESTENPKKYFQNNVLSGLNLLQTMASHNNCKKIIYSSSAAVYGIPKKIPITEDSPLVPINPYGQTKKLFELILQEYAQAGLINSVALRYFNVAGAYITSDGAWGENHNPESHLIPLILCSAHRKRNFTIFGNDYPTTDGTCVRDYIHVYDLAQAHILAMNNKRDGALVYNVGTGRGYSNKEVFDVAQKVAKEKIPYTIGKRRVGDCSMLTASPKKIKRELGFEPIRSDLKTIITDAWHYHKLKKS